jgi:putative DNA primase/helicase
VLGRRGVEGPEQPPLGEFLPCRNGLLHLPTRILLAHTPQRLAESALPFDYDPSAPEPTRWLAFLKSLWPDDQDAIDTLQEIIGVMVTGDTKYQRYLP